MKRIELIASDSLAPGMLVAQSVLDDSGRVLVSAGAMLSDNIIASLRRREVQAVMVELVVDEDPEALEARRGRVKQRLDALFCQAGDSEEMRALYQTIFEHRMEHGE